MCHQTVYFVTQTDVGMSICDSDKRTVGLKCTEWVDAPRAPAERIVCCHEWQHLLSPPAIAELRIAHVRPKSSELLVGPEVVVPASPWRIRLADTPRTSNRR